MAMPAQHIPAPWNSLVERARSAAGFWPSEWMIAYRTVQDGLLCLLGSDRFALGLGGVLWSAFVFVVVRGHA